MKRPHKSAADKFRERQAGAAGAKPSRNGCGAPPRTEIEPAPHVRTLEPYRPFPTEALPQPLREFVRQGALALGCDGSYLALPALAVAAAAIGNARVVRLKRSWREPCVIWSVIIGESGTLKSPTLHIVLAPVYRVQERLQNAFRQRLKEYKEAKRQAKEADTDPPDEPILERVIVSDTTIEKLAEILEDNPRGILVGKDELSSWLASFTRYKGKTGGTDLPNWLEAHRAGCWLVDRKTGPRTHYFVPHAAVSICGGIQPGVFARALTPEFFDAGLPARLLPAAPPAPPKKWSEVEIDPQTERDYESTLDRLLSLDFGADGRGERVPRVLTMSAEAKAAWVRHYNAWAQEQAATEGELAAAYSKLEGYAARFALIHHVVSRVACGEDDLAPIAVESIEAGITLCRWFAGEARRVYSTLSESTEEKDSRKLVEYIRARGGEITARALQRSNNRKYPTAETAEAALDVLAGGLGEWVEPAAGAKRGQSARRFILRPTPDTTDNCRTESADGSNTHDAAEGPQGGSVGREGVVSDGQGTAPLTVASLPPDGKAEFEGRGILEYDGGLPRKEAEAQVLAEVVRRMSDEV